MAGLTGSVLSPGDDSINRTGPAEADSSRQSRHSSDLTCPPLRSDVDRTPIATASQLGVLARLTAAAGFPQHNQRSLSLAELAGSSADSTEPDPGHLAGLMEALVSLSVAEEGDEPKTYRLANLPPASTASGNSSINQSGAPESAIEASPHGMMFGTSPPGVSMQPVAWQSGGYGQTSAMYPMYGMYPAGTSPPQYYAPMSGPRPVAMMQGPAGHPAPGITEAHSGPVMPYGMQAGPGFAFNATPLGSAPGKPTGPHSWGAAQFPSSRNMANGSVSEANSGGNMVAPPPPPPRSMSSSSTTSQASRDTQLESSKLSSTSGKSPCAFFLKTGTCAYGDKCKFGHPPGRLPPQLNSLGYPLRPAEAECVYFMKRGVCGFGVTCKFNHPEPNAPSWHGAAGGMQRYMSGGPMMMPYSGMMQAPVMPVVAFTQPLAMPQPGPMPPVVSVPPMSPSSGQGHWSAPPPPPPPAGVGSPPSASMSQLGMTASSPTAQLHEILGIVPSSSSTSTATAVASDGNRVYTDSVSSEKPEGPTMGSEPPTESSVPADKSANKTFSHEGSTEISSADGVRSYPESFPALVASTTSPEAFAVTAT